MRALAKPYVSTQQAAKLLGVSLKTVQLWADKGLLKCWVTEGGHRRIDSNSVQAIIDCRNTLDAETPVVSHELCVLVVEDEEAQRKIYQQHLFASCLPIQLLFARNGFEALIQIGRRAPDVLITDLKMPGMDGFELLRALETVPELQHSCIVAVSSLDEWQVKQGGGLPDRVTLFSKPIPFNILIDLIRQAHKKSVEGYYNSKNHAKFMGIGYIRS